MVTILFISTRSIESTSQGKCQEIKTVLVRLIGETLVAYKRGYHCNDLMVAFENPTDAIRFSFMFQERLRERENHDSEMQLKLSHITQFGCVHGQFAAMGPHKTSGRAEYLGKVVNRAARVADTASPGSVYFGTTDEVTEPFELVNDIQLTHVGVRTLKGIQDDIILYSCHRFSNNSELPNLYKDTPCQ